MPIPIVKTTELESPLYRTTYNGLGAGVVQVQDLYTTKPYDKYTPFNYLYVSNQSDKTLVFNVGGVVTKSIPPNTIQAIDGDTVKSFGFFSFQTSDGLAATGSIEVAWQKVATQRDVLISIQRKLAKV